MKSGWSLIATFLLLVVNWQSNDLRAQDPHQIVDGKLAQSLEDFVSAVHENLGFSGSVFAAKSGKPILAIAYGSAHVDGKSLVSTALFEIASCTKPFTAVAIMQLAEDGKLALDDPISKHVPGVPKNGSGITIRHLVAHTSGIPATNTLGSPTDAEAAFKSFLRGGPQHKPGTHYEYWNQGYSILSEIIARTSGMSYTNYVKSKIFDPAGMKVSRFTGDDAPDGLLVATGRSRSGNRSALSHPYGGYGFQYRGMGGLVTNVFDLWQFDRALAENRILSKSLLAEMTQTGDGNHSLGWQIESSPDGNPCHGHGGGVRGFRAQMWRYPSIDGALFVLCNNEDSSTSSIVHRVGEKFLFGKKVAFTFPSRPSDDLLKQASGSYVDTRKRRLVIGACSDGLPTVKIYWGGPVTHGYLGVTAQGKPALYMVSKSKDGFGFKVDSDLEFEKKGNGVQSVSLMGIKSKLTFRRVGAE